MRHRVSSHDGDQDRRAEGPAPTSGASDVRHQDRAFRVHRDRDYIRQHQEDRQDRDYIHRHQEGHRDRASKVGQDESGHDR